MGGYRSHLCASSRQRHKIKLLGEAIAVVLSGADGDGSLGLKAIKAGGGLTFAQCEDTAKFDSMPNTAVATGNVDFVLPPQKIAEELANLSHNPSLSNLLPLINLDKLPQQRDALGSIFVLLRSLTGVDFSHYKPSPPTLAEVVNWIARLGGFLGRKGDGSPGVKVLWRGLTRLHDLVEGWLVCQSLNR